MPPDQEMASNEKFGKEVIPAFQKATAGVAAATS
jgi:hypothetical protein